MHPWFRRLLPAVLLVAALLAALASRAQAEPRLSGWSEVVRAGESIDIAWSDLPAGTHEVELKVSIDGGRWKRISPELEAHEGHFVWRVPKSMRGEARVRLCYGGGHGEEEAAPSEAFRIEGDAVSGPARLDADDQWTSRGGFGHGGSGEWMDGAPHLSATLVSFDAELPPRMGGTLPELRITHSPVSAMSSPSAAPASPARAARVFTPLRN